MAAAAVACGGESERGPSGSVEPIAELPERDEVGSASASATTEDVTLSLEATVWHDDMPTVRVDPDDEVSEKGMMVSTTVKSSSNEIPAGLRLERVYVLHGSEVWSSAYDDQDPEHSNELQGVARNGPSWRGPESVDVVVRIRTKSGEALYLAEHDVEIRSVR